ncbi:MAG: FixH family protein [Saprospiraceae bacterium]
MFKNFHWGHGIAIFYTIFVIAVISALVASMGIDHSLVVDNYYEKDLAYQSHYDKTVNNLNDDNLNIEYDNIAKSISFNFSNSKKLNGTIHFYRPSNKTEDFIKNIDSNHIEISSKNMSNGKWLVKVDWIENGKPYYKEEELYI